MTVYVAGDSVMHRYVTEIMDELDSVGYEVSHRWDNDARYFYQTREANGIKMTEEEAYRISEVCIRKVRESTVFILLYDASARIGSGKWVELGLALAQRGRKHIIVYSENDVAQTKDVFLYALAVKIIVGRRNLVSELDRIRVSLYGN